jgi:hypothetical protein
MLKSRMFAALVGATAVAAIGGGIGWAAIPDPAGVIHGCCAKSNGAMRAIDTGNGQTCAKAEAPLDWNQTGPRGQNGAAGADGVSGRET